MATDPLLRIEVVYALAERQVIVELEVAPGTNVSEAVGRSGLARQFPEIQARPLACAIFGRAVPPGCVVGAGDRVEILRPLLIDPKENRRQAAARSKAAAGGRR